MKNLISFFLLIYVILFAQQSKATDSNQDCGRLATGDNFNELNSILDCIESKITDKSLVTATNVAVYGEEKEPNDRVGNANVVQLGTTVQGRIKAGGEYDYFRFTAPDSDQGVLIIMRQVNPNGLFYPGLQVYDDEENLAKSANGTPGQTISLPGKTQPKQEYFIVLSCRIGCDNDDTTYDYELLVREQKNSKP